MANFPRWLVKATAIKQGSYSLRIATEALSHVLNCTNTTMPKHDRFCFLFCPAAIFFHRRLLLLPLFPFAFLAVPLAPPLAVFKDGSW